MHINQSDDNSFDNLLKAGLRKQAVNVPQDFTQRLLTRIQREEYAAALARIKRSERLLVAAMVIVPVTAALIFALIGPQMITYMDTFLSDARLAIASHTGDMILPLKYWLGIVGMATILIYAIYDQILAEN